METVQSGDQYDFTGTLITVPDVGVLSFPGAKADMKNRSKGGGENVTDGVRGLKALGVRNLNYRLAFLACSAMPSNPQVSPVSILLGLVITIGTTMSMFFSFTVVISGERAFPLKK